MSEVFCSDTLSCSVTFSAASITDDRGRKNCLRLKVFVRPQSEQHVCCVCRQIFYSVWSFFCFNSACDLAAVTTDVSNLQISLSFLFVFSRQLCEKLWELAGRSRI